MSYSPDSVTSSVVASQTGTLNPFGYTAPFLNLSPKISQLVSAVPVLMSIVIFFFSSSERAVLSDLVALRFTSGKA